MKEHHNNEGNPAFLFFSHISLILEFFKKQENGKREPPAPPGGGGGGVDKHNILHAFQILLPTKPTVTKHDYVNNKLK